MGALHHSTPSSSILCCKIVRSSHPNTGWSLVKTGKCKHNSRAPTMSIFEWILVKELMCSCSLASQPCLHAHTDSFALIDPVMVHSVSWMYNSLLVPIAMSSMCFLCVSIICLCWLAPLSFWSSIHAVGKVFCCYMHMWDSVSRHSWIVYGISFTCFTVSHKTRAVDPPVAFDLCRMGPKWVP